VDQGHGEVETTRVRQSNVIALIETLRNTHVFSELNVAFRGVGGNTKLLVAEAKVWRQLSERLLTIYNLIMLKNIRDCGRSIRRANAEFQYQISVEGTERLCREHIRHWSPGLF